jgi:hypothetical protein
MSGQSESELLRVELTDPAPIEVDLLRGLQRVLLTHPVACQAAFSAMIAEGRRFAETAEGREWRDRLVHSPLLAQVRLVFDLSTLGMLEERGGAGLPTNYLDALFMVAAGGDADGILNRMFWAGSEETPRGRSND